MNRKHLLIGISAAALAAGSAAAQTTTTGTNRSTVTSNGTGNSQFIDIAGEGNERNSSTIIQNGDDNFAFVRQVGDDNRSRIEQIGEGHQAFHQQFGNFNNADTRQSGNDHFDNVVQQGNNNTATVVQANGEFNSAEIFQGAASGEGFGANANANTGRITQNGSDNDATINQRIDAGGVYTGYDNNTGEDIVVANNFARIQQGVTSPSNFLSTGNSATINQSSRGNSASVFMFEGGFDNDGNRTGNTVTVNQGESGGSTDESGSGTRPSNSTASNNMATVSVRGFGNSASLTQNGRNNALDVTIQQGGSGNGAALQTDPETGRTQGNGLTVNQNGTGLSGLVVIGSALVGQGQGTSSTITQQGRDHSATVYSRGVLDTVRVTQRDGALNAGSGATNRAVANVSTLGLRNTVTVDQTGDNFAEVTQGFGRRSEVSITQTDAGDIGAGAQDPDNPFSTPTPGARGFNRVLVSSNGNATSLTVVQNTRSSSATVFQQAGPSAASDVTGTATSTGTTGSNVGTGRNANNRVNLQQGSGQTSALGFGAGGGSTFAFGASTVGNSEGLTANIEQGNGGTTSSNNRADVRQDGTNLSATVLQRGNASTSSPNLVQIGQQGTNNTATARQLAGVGPSGTNTTNNPASGPAGNTFSRGAGSQSAEITILQRNRDNTAFAQQEGRGQLARIEQSGQRNSASIFQGASATNATAIIRQTGNDNTYTVTQTSAGQFILVDQTGNANAVTTITQSGPAS